MTMETQSTRRRVAPAAALTALLLAGCTSGHVGEDWQCPLAAGGSCASVAAADPAVPKAGAVQAGGQPIRLLPREWDTETNRAGPSPARGPGQAPMEARSCEADCGFDPFAWLARLFGADTDGDDGQSAGTPPATTKVEEAPERPAPDGVAEAPAAALPAEPASGDGLAGDDLRTGETVARIWIAPFVDADGVYREGAWVRVVLEPAGWRLP